ncbi:C1 family peptidase [Burkholderia cenocepacia]|jgi:hypothetical protein|uniref:C1 family peptidase n=1 Tax=Burkholderia cenocepacia TaxID=95486 RepID=UPI0024B848BB|nr:C1 family peptidase [Burkholderia cenocepacia]MDI9689981.1 C1 family peptidase [Burkholderia cenocepacia]
MATGTVQTAWSIRTSKVPKGLLKALPGFTNPVDTAPARERRLFESIEDAHAGPSVSKIDWRSTGAVSPPGYQGQCNTCTSFAIVAAMEALHYIKVKTRVTLAPGFIHTCLLNRRCEEGAGASEALDAASAHGVALSFPGAYPFPTKQCGIKNLYTVRQRVWLAGPNEAMLALANHGPVVGDMWIAPDFVSLPAGKIYRFQDTPERRLHSVCVIGFDREQGCWIVSNSFGQKWGDGGFAKVAFGSGGLLGERGGWQIIL